MPGMSYRFIEISHRDMSAGFQPPLKPFDSPASFGRLGLGTGLYSYSFDSQTAPFRGFTLTVVGRNE